MGCSSSTNTAVQPLRPEEVNGDEEETGSKLDGRGDSAVSKGTTDSGVVMENPVLPGEVPRKLPLLTSVRESEVDRNTQNGVRPKSSEILEELLNQGIIPVGQRGSAAGEAYSIMLDDREGVRRRPPARLESLRTSKTQSVSIEQIEEKIRLAEERRKLRTDELQTRLRTKSARVRGPAPTSSAEAEEDTTLTPVEPILHPLTSPDQLDPTLLSQISHVEAESGEHVRETGGDGGELGGETGGACREEGGESGENTGEGPERISEDGDGEEEDEGEEELTEVEEFKKDQLLVASGELENDHSFQHAEDKEEMF
uniref:stathmin domain-containing protein 1 n=1 Tax=Scatophagus argus TaxID=75038 RepID=UPI001ED85993|nr:stathmin domain-containing protein 1 [Scatophagus argus]